MSELEQPTESIHSLSFIAKKQDGDIATQKESNTVFIVQGKIALEAVEDKILVLLDKFKSGYECKTCNETGVLETCPCINTDHESYKYKGSPIPCSYCGGEPSLFTKRTCPDCKGEGTTLIIPETSKGIPTSGVICSVGPLCKTRHIGERVIFGPHVGYYLPFKGNVRIRVMREFEPMCKIHALDNNLALGDFMAFEEPQRND